MVIAENYRQGEERGELNEGLVGDMCGKEWNFIE
jgi:hypothetical protein